MKNNLIKGLEIFIIYIVSSLGISIVCKLLIPIVIFDIPDVSFFELLVSSHFVVSIITIIAMAVYYIIKALEEE